MQTKCALILSTGESFEGLLIGYPKVRSGEMVFTTGMVGYSEAITDPSYFGQILVFSYPLIGNYGIPSFDPTQTDVVPQGFESANAHVGAIILTTDSQEAHHWNSYQSLDRWLYEQKVSGLVGIDTRHLVHIIRNNPQLYGRIEPLSKDTKTSSYEFYNPSEHNVISRVSTDQRRTLNKNNSGKKVGLVDCGVKWNIVRQLIEFGCEVELLPWDTNLSEVNCDGWLISNGPGNPENTGNLVEQVQSLLQQKKPILGICLGHQILALASGAKTKRMRYGHRGHNQPVYLVGTRRGFITSQNHGYVVESESLAKGWESWFANVNDQTNEGIMHDSGLFRSVQFHPEAAGGPRDTAWIIKDFVESLG